ncbi:MocR-like pyridoxine biosynthesis transcription factor PdxR [Sphingobacterium rhinopitheci]|uniref:MocR-like pyridoxine biosynthesis transcription factor PdxR n=1 Tax=Sphingobacterium rhinopitheci TaxID=2781960 RepID=UPI001F52451B|nr:PLP-dependent aminotransferase family protein [Sphingobacterium rhinopitheci]MCI0922746.1 PLP-dependent aminotransferase family protein [Sphingobacterium rhinopitheci]
MSSPILGNLTLDFKSKGGQSKYLTLSQLLLKYINSGYFFKGQRLPSSRRLAEQLKVNRDTVVKAYEELEQQGWIKSKACSGYYVQNIVNKQSPQKKINKEGNGVDKIIISSKKSAHINNLSIPQMVTQADFHFDDGFPDPKLSFLKEFYQTYRNQMNRGGYYYKYGCYGNPKGGEKFRIVMSHFLNENRGFQISSEHIMSSNGTVMALNLISQSLLTSGDSVIIERPCWSRAEQIFQFANCHCIPVGVDRDGLLVDQLEDICSKTSIKLIYITPHHHYPTTKSLSLDRRLKLLELANRFGFFIIEDDYDYDFQYNQSPLLPLASMDHYGSVIYCGSFSKNLSPTFRLGYIVANPKLIELFAKVRLVVDRQGDHIMDNTIAELVEDGTFNRYIRKSIVQYAKRRDICCEYLNMKLNNFVDFEVPNGGLAIWVKFLPEINLNTLSKKCLKENLFISNGQSHKYDNFNANAIRLGFASSNEIKIKRSIEILKTVIENTSW